MAEPSAKAVPNAASVLIIDFLPITIIRCPRLAVAVDTGGLLITLYTKIFGTGICRGYRLEHQPVQLWSEAAHELLAAPVSQGTLACITAVGPRI